MVIVISRLLELGWGDISAMSRRYLGDISRLLELGWRDGEARGGGAEPRVARSPHPRAVILR